MTEYHNKKVAREVVFLFTPEVIEARRRGGSRTAKKP